MWFYKKYTFFSEHHSSFMAFRPHWKVFSLVVRARIKKAELLCVLLSLRWALLLFVWSNKVSFSSCFPACWRRSCSRVKSVIDSHKDVISGKQIKAIVNNYERRFSRQTEQIKVTGNNWEMFVTTAIQTDVIHWRAFTQISYSESGSLIFHQRFIHYINTKNAFTDTKFLPSASNELIKRTLSSAIFRVVTGHCRLHWTGLYWNSLCNERM